MELNSKRIPARIGRRKWTPERRRKRKREINELKIILLIKSKVDKSFSLRKNRIVNLFSWKYRRFIVYVDRVSNASRVRSSARSGGEKVNNTISTLGTKFQLLLCSASLYSARHGSILRIADITRRARDFNVSHSLAALQISDWIIIE